jgi:hypothetical protein
MPRYQESPKVDCTNRNNAFPTPPSYLQNAYTRPVKRNVRWLLHLPLLTTHSSF